MRHFEIGDLTAGERKILAKKAKTIPIYIWQLGAGIRVPSLHLASDLMRIEPRLTVDGLLAPWYRRQGKLKTRNRK